MGHLVVMDDSPAQLALTTYSLRLWRELSRTLPRHVEYDSCGTIWIAETEAQLPTLVEKRHLYASAHVATEVLDADDVRRLEPELRNGLAGGLLVPGDAVLYAPAATRERPSPASDAGASLREGCRVDDVLPNAVRCGTETFEAPVVVNAAGAAAASLTPGLPVVPRKATSSSRIDIRGSAGIRSSNSDTWRALTTCPRRPWRSTSSRARLARC